MAWQTSENYKNIIYSGDARHKLKILFNGVEFENADVFCESLTVSSRIIPNGTNRFSLDNFISKEAELILHDLESLTIQNPVEISIGTLVDEEYEYVPIGIFNVQDAPTTDNGKTTIKLRDNAVKFDFNYDLEPLITEKGGSVTKLEILNDICSKAEVETLVTEFPNSTDLIGIYDNTITGRTYISYLAEQAGAIPTINREGELIFVYINDLEIQEIPLHIVEKYENGENFYITRVVYEDAIRKFESGDTTGDTLFINASNPYISNEEQVSKIKDIANGFEINSLSTGKIIGNPAIDSYDIIRIVDDKNEYLTLATYELTYNGVITNTFETIIGKEAKKENVTLINEDAKFKRAFTEIDNIKVEVRIVTESTEEIKTDIEENYYNKTSINQLVQNAESGLTNTFSEAGGNNILRNTGLWFEETANKSTVYPSKSLFPSKTLFTGGVSSYEFWEGLAKQGYSEEASNKKTILLQKGTFKQDQEVPNGIYSISFMYRKLIKNATIKVKINDMEYELDSLEKKDFYTGKIDEESGEYITQPLEVKSNHITIAFECNVADGAEIYDLMCNKGSVKLAYSQNQNETTTNTVNISKGITITSDKEKIKFKADYDGIRTIDEAGNTKTRFTDKGMETPEAVVTDEAQICGILMQIVGEQTWYTKM